MLLKLKCHSKLLPTGIGLHLALFELVDEYTSLEGDKVQGYVDVLPASFAYRLYQVAAKHRKEWPWPTGPYFSFFWHIRKFVFKVPLGVKKVCCDCYIGSVQFTLIAAKSNCCTWA